MELFAVLDLPPSVELDLDLLERRYLEKSRAAHPDRFAGDPAEAIELQARVNDAFRVLQDPWTRYSYWIECRHPGLMEERKRLDPGFLAEAMEAHEEVLDALDDESRRSEQEQQTRGSIESTRSRVADLLSDPDDHAKLEEAATLLHQVRYAQRRLEALRGQAREVGSHASVHLMSEDSSPMGPILGIDLGTTNSLVARMDEGGPRILGGEHALLPSVVAILPDEQVLVGDAAKALAFEAPERVIHSIKRLIGRSASELRVEASRLPYRIVEGPQQQARVRIPLDGREGRGSAREYSPEEISSFILRELVARARRALDGTALGDTPRVVITVPAYFDEAQRQATKRAAELAGLQVLRLVNEPTAASLAYGVGAKGEAKDGGTVLVYDLGGGTFDVSILKIQGGVFRVLATHGDTQLGGDDFDRTILEHILQQAGLAIDAEIAAPVLATLRRSAERMKFTLSTESTAKLEIEIGGEAKQISLSREEFEAQIEKALARTARSVRAALADAELSPEQIDDVVLVGGSTRIPAVRSMLREIFAREPHTAIDPDRAVALGAARQAAILSGQDQDLLLLDVVPLSLGIETLGGAFSKLIVRNTTVPCSITEEFSTQVENQSGIDLNVYQGERELVADCRKIASFKLSGIPPMAAGLPRVAVTFTVDQHGLLRVSARELRSGQTASIEVQPSLGLSEDEVRTMVQESIDKAGSDVVAREALDLRNKARAVIRGTDEALARGGDGLEPEQAYSIKKALSRTKKLVDGDDLKALHDALEELSSYTMQLADDLIGAAVRNALQTHELGSKQGGLTP